MDLIPVKELLVLAQTADEQKQWVLYLSKIIVRKEPKLKSASVRYVSFPIHKLWGKWIQPFVQISLELLRWTSLSRWYPRQPIFSHTQTIPKNAAPKAFTYFYFMDKSLGTLVRLWGVFQFTQVQPLPSPHKQCWTRVSRIFSEFQLCIGWGEGDLQENFEKYALF